MSKKLASGADAICLDVKVGHGAFMKTEEEAVKLAELMVSIGKLAGKKVTAILTGMDEPLGHKIGNALEVYEAIETLQGNGPEDLVEVTLAIGSQLLLDANIASSNEEAIDMMQQSLHDMSAYNKFLELVKAQGGDVNVLKNPELLLSDKKVEVLSLKDGYITEMNALDIGKAAMRLGAGRETKEDEIFLDVGIDLHKKIGDPIKKGEVLATFYVRDKGIEEAKTLLLEAITIGEHQKSIKLIKRKIS
jgi:pyrimidine-nucleoside phosphorylase